MRRDSIRHTTFVIALGDPGPPLVRTTMSTPILPITVLLFFSSPAIAQLHAGEVPSGSSAIDVGVDLILNTSFSEDSAGLEVDCDDQPDITVVLIHGAPPVDAPNVALLRMVDDDLEFCADLAIFPRPKYYAFDELLECPVGSDWQSGPELVLGDFGSFTAIGPTIVDSQYVAYRRGTDVGWILLSFDVSMNTGVSLKIHQVLPICPTTLSISPYELPPAVTLFPNPSNGGPIRVESADAVQSIEILDATGRSIVQTAGTMRTIEAPEVAGAYWVRAVHADGRWSVARLVKY